MATKPSSSIQDETVRRSAEQEDRVATWRAFLFARPPRGHPGDRGRAKVHRLLTGIQFLYRRSGSCVEHPEPVMGRPVDTSARLRTAGPTGLLVARASGDCGIRNERVGTASATVCGRPSDVATPCSPCPTGTRPPRSPSRGCHGGSELRLDFLRHASEAICYRYVDQYRATAVCLIAGAAGLALSWFAGVWCAWRASGLGEPASHLRAYWRDLRGSLAPPASTGMAGPSTADRHGAPLGTKCGGGRMGGPAVCAATCVH